MQSSKSTVVSENETKERNDNSLNTLFEFPEDELESIQRKILAKIFISYFKNVPKVELFYYALRSGIKMSTIIGAFTDLEDMQHL